MGFAFDFAKFVYDTEGPMWSPICLGFASCIFVSQAVLFAIDLSLAEEKRVANVESRLFEESSELVKGLCTYRG